MGFGLAGDIWTLGGDTDTDTPLVVRVVVARDGDSISVYLDTASERGGGHSDSDFTLTASGGAVTLTYSSGDGTSVLVFTTSRTIDVNTESATLDYTQPGNGIESSSDNTDLASFSGFAVKGFLSGGLGITRFRLTGRGR